MKCAKKMKTAVQVLIKHTVGATQSADFVFKKKYVSESD